MRELNRGGVSLQPVAQFGATESLKPIVVVHRLLELKQRCLAAMRR
jgi:hypothetical protein